MTIQIDWLLCMKENLLKNKQKISTNTSPTPNDFTGNFHQTYIREFILVFLKIYLEIEWMNISN